jgi:hypothetical protein
MSVEGGTEEITVAAHTGDRKIWLMSSLEVEGARSRIPGGGRAVESAPEKLCIWGEVLRDQELLVGKRSGRWWKKTNMVEQILAMARGRGDRGGEKGIYREEVEIYFITTYLGLDEDGGESTKETTMMPAAMATGRQDGAIKAKHKGNLDYNYTFMCGRTYARRRRARDVRRDAERAARNQERQESG